MFILSTTHIALAVSELLQGFVFDGETTPGGSAVFYRINMFPKRKVIYTANVRPFFLSSLRRCVLLFISWLLYVVKKLFKLITHDFSFYHLDALRRFPLLVGGQIWRVHVIYGRSWIVCPPCVRSINTLSLIPLTSNLIKFLVLGTISTFPSTFRNLNTKNYKRPNSSQSMQHQNNCR